MARGKTVQTLLRGAYIVDGRQAGQIHKLFVDSAEFTGPKPPKDFKMGGGEIFYEGGKIAEVRLAGRLSPIKKGERAGVWPGWRQGRDPHFDVTDGFRLVLSPHDQGRPYVAAVRIGGFFLLSWDVTSSTADHTPADADVRFIRIAPPVETSSGRGEETTFEAAIKYVDRIAQSATELKTFLSLLRDGTGVHVMKQQRAFRHAYGPLLKQRIDDGVPYGAVQLSFSMKEMKAAEMRRRLVLTVAAMTRDYLAIRSGRKKGSKTEPRDLNAKKIERDLKKKERLKKKILRAITAEYRKFRRKSPPAEAESQVTINVVVARLKTNRSSFYNWRRQAGCTFEALKTEALKRSRD